MVTKQLRGIKIFLAFLGPSFAGSGSKEKANRNAYRQHNTRSGAPSSASERGELESRGGEGGSTMSVRYSRVTSGDGSRRALPHLVFPPHSIAVPLQQLHQSGGKTSGRMSLRALSTTLNTCETRMINDTSQRWLSMPMPPPLQPPPLAPRSSPITEAERSKRRRSQLADRISNKLHALFWVVVGATVVGRTDFLRVLMEDERVDR